MNISKLLCIALLLPVYNTYTLRRLDERPAAHKTRKQATKTQMQNPWINLAAQTNGDDIDVPNRAGSFTKLLEHDVVDGILTAYGSENYNQLLLALETDVQADFNAIEFSSPAVLRKLINPQAGFAFSMEGCDSSQSVLPFPPKLTSAWAAAEMLEVYLQAVCRDVAFSDYGTGLRTDVGCEGGSATNQAVAVLNDLGAAYKGPKNNQGNVTISLLFRGLTAGDRVGPYISQFFLQPLYPLFPAGCAGYVAGLIGVQNLPQDILAHPQLIPIAQKREFGVSWDDFVALQNGFIPKEYVMTDYDQTNLRYPINGRDLGSLDHSDSPYLFYTNALNILAYRGFPLSKGFPYNNGLITKEAGLITMGGGDAYALVGGVMAEAFKAAWAYKWRAYRRLRPEAMAGIVHRAKVTGDNKYHLDLSLFETHNGVDVLALVLCTNQLQATVAYDPQQLLTREEASTYLLAQMYPEGSPVHPSYPSGHATVAGACTTVIKAIFEDTTKLITHMTPVKVNPLDPTGLVPLVGEGENVMTVGGELDKLASNVAFGRNFAGVHYRADADQGMALGEQVAIRYLQDHARIYQEQGFVGFEFTKRNGERIRVTADDVVII